MSPNEYDIIVLICSLQTCVVQLSSATTVRDGGAFVDFLLRPCRVLSERKPEAPVWPLQSE